MKFSMTLNKVNPSMENQSTEVGQTSVVDLTEDA